MRTKSPSAGPRGKRTLSAASPVASPRKRRESSRVDASQSKGGVSLPQLLPKGSPWHFVSLGERVRPIEWPLIYVFFPALVFVYAPPAVTAIFLTNATRQLILFLLVCQLPVLATGKMWFVDVAWPWGLVLMALTAFQGTGWWLRRLLVSTTMLLHGGRMALGAILLFGVKTKFTYVFEEDLQRYVYAKHRWGHHNGMPDAWWWIKAQHETLQQCFANSVLLALPILLPAVNPSTNLSVLEIVGWLFWLLGWVFESAADMQKQVFLRNTKRLKVKDATLGLAPWAGKEYFLWNFCRHPNYFGEWCCWLGFVISALPSLCTVCATTVASTPPAPVAAASKTLWFDLFARLHAKITNSPSATAAATTTPMWVCCGLGLGLIYTLRLFYDCLVHWTGAAPSEHFSAAKRPGYQEYQRKVPCFWPRFMPAIVLGCFDHFQRPCWQ